MNKKQNYQTKFDSRRDEGRTEVLHLKSIKNSAKNYFLS